MGQCGKKGWHEAGGTSMEAGVGGGGGRGGRIEEGATKDHKTLDWYRNGRIYHLIGSS